MLKPSAPPITSVEDSFYPRPEVVTISTLSTPSRNPVQSPINPNFNINDTYPSASSGPRIIYVANPPTNPTNSSCCRSKLSRPLTVLLIVIVLVVLVSVLVRVVIAVDSR